MSAPNPEKGARYLGLLDQALCDGNWSEVPELARKVEKHAPERKSLCLAARTEAQVAAASHRGPTAPSGDSIANLKESTSTGQVPADDSYIVRACMSEIYWLREEWDSAVDILPSRNSSNAGRGAGVLGWLEVCEVRSYAIQAAAAEKSGQDDEARRLYLAAVQRTPGSRSSELRRWTERLLARACMFTYEKCSSPTLSTLSDALRCFTSWSHFWRRAPPPKASNVSPWPSPLNTPRTVVWRSYYELLSIILQRNLTADPSAASDSTLLLPSSDDVAVEQLSGLRSRQRSIFAEVEATYETLLLNETKFPKAEQSNSEIETWVDQVMGNWQIFCSGRWRDSDFGEGGRNSVSRAVLSVLYRAATKTFHSTSILRHLFHVHAALGEFDLALHAFDSYIELVDKAKARAQKTHQHELGHDSDDSAILAACDAVRMLCRYGDLSHAEKALVISSQIDAWLEQGSATTTVTTSADGELKSDESGTVASNSGLNRKTVSAAYLAMGIAHAHWARLTYDPDTRGPLQTEALQHLRQAHSLNQSCLQTIFALALMLVEIGELNTATQLLKRAIAAAESADARESGNDEGDEAGSEVAFESQRQLVPLWHLLALCLTAKDEYEQAAKLCEAAFDQFGAPTLLFGDTTDPLADSSKQTTHSDALVDRMGGLEKEALLQIKMTQLTLVELMEGPDAALDMTHALLGLYARLFGFQEVPSPLAQRPRTTPNNGPAKMGSLRSFAGSIRPRSVRNSAEREAAQQSSFSTAQVSAVSVSSPPQTGSNTQGMGAPIAITVTNEDGHEFNKHRHKHLLPKLRGSAADWRHSKSTDDLHQKSDPQQSQPTFPTAVESEALPMRGANTSSTVSNATAAMTQDATPSAVTNPRQPLDSVPHNVAHDALPAPAGHEAQPPRQDIRLPSAHPATLSAPEPRLQTLQERQHKVGLLVKVWLMIAGIYIRSELFTDAAEATEEADKLVSGLELEMSSEQSQARRFAEKRWGGGKSVDELWADVFSAKGELAAARQLPFEAMSLYDRALSFYPDHPSGIIGVSNILMDIYEEKLPVEQPKSTLPLPPAAGSRISSTPNVNHVVKTMVQQSTNGTNGPAAHTGDEPTPERLNRLAARDRAYMLLYNLTRLGSSWDNPEAWYSLARAYELSRQVVKAKQALWWVVELEEHRPLRAWRDVAVGGFTL